MTPDDSIHKLKNNNNNNKIVLNEKKKEDKHASSYTNSTFKLNRLVQI